MKEKGTKRKLTEPENLKTLRHRWGRTIEIAAAFHAFHNNEVPVGENYTCPNEHFRWQTSHTLLAVYYSFIYSLFDPRGVNFQTVSEEVVSHLPDSSLEVSELILNHWELVKDKVKIIRHNIGFHGSAKEKGMLIGYTAYQQLHPLSSEYLMSLLRVFFRLIEEVYDVREGRVLATPKIEINFLLTVAKTLRDQIDATPHVNIFSELIQSSNGSFEI